jgi:hypothetical protein
MNPFDLGTFSATPTRQGDVLELVCVGEGDADALEPLEEVLKQVHAEATRASTSAVILDVRQMTFMNSSCFTKLIGWVTKLRALPQEQRYRIRIRSNPQLLWQRRSLHALQCFAVELISIEA